MNGDRLDYAQAALELATEFILSHSKEDASRADRILKLCFSRITDPVLRGKIAHKFPSTFYGADRTCPVCGESWVNRLIELRTPLCYKCNTCGTSFEVAMRSFESGWDGFGISYVPPSWWVRQAWLNHSYYAADVTDLYDRSEPKVAVVIEPRHLPVSQLLRWVDAKEKSQEFLIWRGLPQPEAVSLIYKAMLQREANLPAS